MGLDDLLFSNEESDEIIDKKVNELNYKEPTPWKLLIVDDEQEVHSTTKLVLSDFEFEGAKLEFLHATSGTEAMAILQEHTDIAVVLLDVVMETPTAGLECARAIRQELQNHLVRIVLRTGQPGQAPERQVIMDYDINDYKNKSELTSQKLFTTVYTAIRSYKDMVALDKQRIGLRYIIDASAEFFQQRSIQKLATGVLTQIEALFRLQNSLYLREHNISAAIERGKDHEWRILTATGKYTQAIEGDKDLLMDDRINRRVQQVVDAKKSLFFGDCFIGYFPTQKDHHHILYMEDCGNDNWVEVQDLLDIFTNNVGIAFDNIYLNQEIIDTQHELVMRLGEVVESRSKETANHVCRVAEYTHALALAYGLSPEEANIIKLASPMHDIGKIGISDSILLKPGKLTDDEFKIMQSHTTIGQKILAGSKRPLLKMAESIAYTHHERWDGKGYPQGIAKEDIPLAGRLTCLADVFDALGSDRVYKTTWSLDDVLAYIQSESGGMFEPKLIEIFLDNLDTLLSIKEQYKD